MYFDRIPLYSLIHFTFPLTSTFMPFLPNCI